jgi:hypothetical protein
MDKAGSERRLTGRDASIAKRRAMAAGGKARLPSPEPPARAARDPAATRATPGHTLTAPELSPAPRSIQLEPVRNEARRKRQPPKVAEGRQRSIKRREQITHGRRHLTRTSPTETLRSSTQGLVGRDAAIARRRAIASSTAQIRPAPPAQTRPDVAARRARRSVEQVEVKPRVSEDTSKNRARPTRPRGAASKAPKPPRGRMLSMARRAATSDRGKAGADSVSGRSRSAATTALLRNAGVSSRDIARRVREERCEHGKCGDVGPRPSGRARRAAPSRPTEGPSKVGVSATALGQTVTGTRVGRSARTTGDEPGSCRQVTGTEYLGAELFQEFCGVEPTPAPNRIKEAIMTDRGQTVTGAQVGRSPRVTGDETGAGRTLTGTPYTSPGPEGAPPKVRSTQTYSGRSVTGSMIGRSERMTGNEPGSCQRVTGNEYLGFEHYQGYCRSGSEPEPHGSKKVGADATWHGQQVTGSLVGRSRQVTGNEPGTCEIVTGTAYLGQEQFRSHCAPETLRAIAQRTPSPRGTPGAGLTGIQPGIDGGMTGAAKGVCQEVTGTPYIGEDQFFATCGQGVEATPGSADFPQPLSGGNWGAFSVESPAQAAQSEPASRMITGIRYDQPQDRVTGPFNMASGVVTGTEDFRQRRPGRAQPRGVGINPAPLAPPTPREPAGPVADARPRITGEGREGGTRITGNDWGRNERVTGTEGKSAVGRNPTRRGAPMGPFAGARTFREAQERQVPEIRVSGSSGSTERGALVTLSGGARG